MKKLTAKGGGKGGGEDGEESGGKECDGDGGDGLDGKRISLLRQGRRIQYNIPSQRAAKQPRKCRSKGIN